MELTAKLDDYGKPAWIAVMVLGFILFWPIGLAILAYMIWSGRMGCSKRHGPGRWYNGRSENGKSQRSSRGRRNQSSGNAAFDEYREETLRRLEEEASEFGDFLSSLRHAKDKAEFDQFMKDRGARPDFTDVTDIKDDGTNPAPNSPA